jgi:hypothetical protein
VNVNVPAGGAGRLVGLLSSQLLWSPIEVNILNLDHWAQVRVNGGAWQDIKFRKPVPTGLSGRQASTIDTPLTFAPGNNKIEFNFDRPPNATWHSGSVHITDLEVQLGTGPSSSPPPPPPPTNTTVPATATAGLPSPTATLPGVPPAQATATATAPVPATPTTSAPAPATPTKTAPPAPTATSTPPSSPPPPPTIPWTAGWLTKASTSQITASPGGTARATVNVTSEVARSALVDIEIYDPSGKKVKQFIFDGQAFAAGGTKTYPVQWNLPGNSTTGTYSIRIGVFSVGWGTLYHWNHYGATFQVR